jgi:predicted phosphate transport protein (TIGR00153 family)
MFAWFQRLLPRSGDFFGMFERHGATIVAAAEALDAMTRGASSNADCIRTIRDREHDADEVIREVLHAVRQTFLTPFDRGAITSLIGAMDDTIDEMQSAASAVEIYGVESFDPQMQEIAVIVLQAARLIAEALPLLREVDRNGHRLHELTGQLVALEGKVDILHDTGLKNHFQKARDGGRALDFLVAKEIYKHLERIADSFEDVANEIDALVIDHA